MIDDNLVLKDYGNVVSNTKLCEDKHKCEPAYYKMYLMFLAHPG